MKNIPARHAQQGIATLLFLIFIGVALTVAILNSVNSVNSAQEQSIAMHSSTQAQAKAWTGVDIIQKYLLSLAENDMMASLVSSIPGDPAANPLAIPITGVDNLAAAIVGYDAVTQQITINVTATSAANTGAAATSTVQVVYQVGGGSGSGSASGTSGTPSVITFNRNLRLGGSIIVETPAGEDYIINVNGDVTTGGNTITGVSTFNVTGSVDIGSASSFNQINSNGDIRLTGAVSGDENLSALGNICLTGSASANGEVRANGSVTGEGSADFGNIYSRGSSDNVGTQLCGALANDADGNPYGVDLRSNSTAVSITTSASIRAFSGGIGTLEAENHLVDNNWGGTMEGEIGGSFSNGGNPDNYARITITPGLSVAVAQLQPLVIDVARFDANVFKDSANYVFQHNGSDIIITVNNVSGIPNGDYYLGDNTSLPAPKKDRLCTHSTCGDGDSYPFCKGYSPGGWNTCFSYNSSQEKWSIFGKSMSPGIAWFEGNLEVGNGTYYSTFIASGNLETSGNHSNYAPNYAGYSGAGGSNGICNNAIYPYYPTELCNADGTYNAEGFGGIGNFAYLAGSVDASDNYVGGDIDLGSQTNAFGSILAGNEFTSGGNTTVYGYITAEAQGASTNNAMGGSTRIVVTNLPTSYAPMGSITVEGDGEGDDGPAEVDVLWTRYL